MGVFRKVCGQSFFESERKIFRFFTPHIFRLAGLMAFRSSAEYRTKLNQNELKNYAVRYDAHLQLGETDIPLDKKR